jgi:hypothetical protein
VMRQNDTQVDLNTRAKATLVVGLMAGVITVVCSRFVGFWPAVVTGGITVGLVGSVFVRRVFKWPVRPWVHRVFRDR